MITYLITLVSLVGLDAIWLNLVAKGFYKKYLGYIFAEKFTLWPIIAFYLIYTYGVIYFVVGPALEAKSLPMALWRGALLGLLAYGAYDFTNQATLAKWPQVITFVDLLWGVVFTAAGSAIAYLIVSKI